MQGRAQRSEDFSAAFEAAFARFQVCVEGACAGQPDWPSRISAAICAGFEFAAEERAAANLLTNEALAGGADGIARYRRILAYIGNALSAGRSGRLRGAALPQMTEQALAGGLLALVAERLSRGSAAELPSLAPEAIQFTLTPYLGRAEAELVAALAEPPESEADR
jgi:hypothetical protein